ncbi:MAG: tripartite tricarboxylate transporter TctB family protein, partial [Nitrospira sp.]|nr:tripartite tricarboxylate transporter TctB family protein [Nitrospira sp.]
TTDNGQRTTGKIMNNILIGLGTMILGGVILFLIWGFPELDDGYPGPALFPGILAGLFIVFGMVLLAQSIWVNLLLDRSRKHTGENPRFPLSQAGDTDQPVQNKLYSFKGILNVACVLAAILLYIFFVETLGFLITGFFLLALLMIKLGVPSWKSGMISLLSTVGIYMLFAKLLKVPLPWGLLSW